MNRINLIGVELEGCWHTAPAGAHGDGSVEVTCQNSNCRYSGTAEIDCSCGCDSCEDGDHCADRDDDCHARTAGRNTGRAFTGELSGSPMHIDQMEAYILANYPDHVDTTCGMHVHLSFIDESDYSRLMYDDFWEYFQKSWAEWAPLHLHPKSKFWDRFEGNNTFCKREFIPDRQWAERGRCDARYRQLNFCWGVHRTLECRLLPMFKHKTTSVKAIWWLISMINTFLNTCEKPTIETEEIVDTEASEAFEEEEIIDMVVGIPRLDWVDPEVPYVFDRLSTDTEEVISEPLIFNFGHPDLLAANA